MHTKWHFLFSKISLFLLGQRTVLFLVLYFARGLDCCIWITLFFFPSCDILNMCSQNSIITCLGKSEITYGFQESITLGIDAH